MSMKSKPAKREINWEAIHESINTARAALGTTGQISESERNRIWQERARQIARVPQEESTGNLVDLIILRIGRETCAFEVTNIETIRPLDEVTRIPRSPNWISGVINLRGQIHSVTDLGRYLRLNSDQNSDGNHKEIVVAKTKQLSLALCVDKVLSIEAMPEQRIKQTSDTIHGVQTEYIRGVIEDYVNENKEKIPVLVLDINTILADDRIFVQEEIN